MTDKTALDNWHAQAKTMTTTELEAEQARLREIARRPHYDEPVDADVALVQVAHLINQRAEDDRRELRQRQTERRWGIEISTIDDLEASERRLRDTAKPYHGPFSSREEELALIEKAYINHPERRFEGWAPARFRNCTLDDCPPQVLTWLDGDDEQDPGWLTGAALGIFGGVGVGKTWLAYAILKRLAAEGYGPHVIPEDARDVEGGLTSQLLDRLRPNAAEPLSIDHLIEPKFLLLDDLGQERPTEWAIEKLGTIIDTRWRDQKPIIFTTNLPPTELKKSLGSRIHDRLKDGCVTVTLKGKSRRQPAQRELHVVGGS